jgi:AraC-like DNA-binding protein
MDALLKEYYSPYDDLQAATIQNLLINLILLSPEINYERQLKSGHLLNYALKLTELVDDYAFSEKKKSFYADMINITERTLDKSLQGIYNRTFKEILTINIIIKAMELLVFSDKSITQIAHELGYDTSDFNKFFFRKKGMSPRILRESYRKMINEIEDGY